MYFQNSTKLTSRSDQHGTGQEHIDFLTRLQIAIEQVGGAEKLADKVGVSLLTVQSWSTGKIDPSRLSLIKIAKASQLSIYWLVAGQNGFQNNPDLWKKLSDNDLDSLEEVILKIKQRLTLQKLNLLPHTQARIVRLVYEFYLLQGHHMNESSVDGLLRVLLFNKIQS